MDFVLLMIVNNSQEPFPHGPMLSL